MLAHIHEPNEIGSTENYLESRCGISDERMYVFLVCASPKERKESPVKQMKSNFVSCDAMDRHNMHAAACNQERKYEIECSTNISLHAIDFTFEFCVVRCIA